MNTSKCPSCGVAYAYEPEECTFCLVPLEPMEAEEGDVLAVTRVDAPSDGHEDVPYWVALSRTVNGLHELHKHDREVSAGTHVPAYTPSPEELDAYGVIGTGVMGRGLVELLLSRGHRVAWVGRSQESIAAAQDRVTDRLARVMDDDDLSRATAALTASTDYEALAQCDVVVEAVVEEMTSKSEVLARAESHLRKDAVLATNTSGLSLDELAEGLAIPSRFGALHFFNPATRMKLVETATCDRTGEETSRRLDEISKSLGKVPVRVAATPAFAVNRALMPLINEAVRELEEGVADADSIDEAVRLGLNHPLGPLALADLIGLDILVNIMDNLAERTGDATYSPRPLLREMVSQGRLGRKTGEGFYSYTPPPVCA